jgi:hypothetical protein
VPRFGDWKKLRDVMRGFDKRLKKNCSIALARAGLALEGMIRDRIISGRGMKPLHPFTVEQKGSSKPLIDDGDLLGSVGYRSVAKDAVFVGAHRRSADGTDLAELHEREEGTRIKVTPKMRAYLHARGLHLKRTTTEIFIPGRPYIKPAFRDFKAKGHMRGLFGKAVTKTLKGE